MSSPITSRLRTVRMSLLIFVLLLVSASGVALAHDSDSASGETDEDVLPSGVTHQGEAESLRHDISRVADSSGVDAGKIRASLDFQDQFGDVVELIFATHSDQVSGVWVEPLPATPGGVAFVANIPADIQRLVDGSDLDIELVPGRGMSSVEHKSRAEEAARALVDAGFVGFETFYDPQSNHLVVNMIEGSSDSAFTTQEVRDVITDHIETVPASLNGASVRAQRVDDGDIAVSIDDREGPFIELTHTRGGNWLRDDGVNECTSGWSVNGSAGNGVLTAGHCTGLNQFVQPGVAPYGMTFRGQEYHNGSRGDVEWHTTTHIELAEFYANATNIRPVTAVELTHTMTGDPVCFYGRASNDRECNLLVAAVNVTVVDDNGNTVHDLSRSNAYAGDIFGESGGGWSFGNRAYGVQHGHTSTASYFTPIDVAEQELNVTILLD